MGKSHKVFASENVYLFWAKERSRPRPATHLVVVVVGISIYHDTSSIANAYSPDTI